MKTTSFNAGWTVRSTPDRQLEIFGAGTEPAPVTLPHDAMIGTQRSPSQAPRNAFFPGGAWEYVKTFDVPREWRSLRAVLRFEGVYRSATVDVNGEFAASQPSGYAEFSVPLESYLRYGHQNTIRVVARAHDDSRWYSGGGIYRNVSLLLGGAVHIAPDGLSITTPDVDADGAIVSLCIEVVNDTAHRHTVTMVTQVLGSEGSVVAEDRVPFTVARSTTGTCRRRLFIPDPVLWGVDDPNLYSCHVRVLEGNDMLDEVTTTFGIRSLALDPRRGLRINGQTVKLRGACVHHDNGILGAATIDRADERRVEILKGAGFNAIRSAHNPMSRSMLDACDRLGVIVMDELYDMWAVGKNDHDHALWFEDRWESEVESMVRKSRNHPSVVLYSIGNEIPEATTPLGAVRGRALIDRIRELDDTRYITNAISPLISLGHELFNSDGAEEDADADVAVPIPTPVGLGPTETGNTLMAMMAATIEPMMLKPMVAERIAEPSGAVDVVGYNYLFRRYRMDSAANPNRVILGTETHSANIDVSWALVEELPQVIGDFSWTGWEYLGEVGIGRTDYKRPGDDPTAAFSIEGSYPWIVSGSGDIDITGHRRPPSYFKEIAFGLREDPYIAVQRPEHHDDEVSYFGAWSWTDSVSSWSWPGHEGAPIVVEVYSAGDEVELLLDEAPLGRRAGGRDTRFRTTFDIHYESGDLTAVSYRDGTEVGRTTLRSAVGPPQLSVDADRSVIRADLTDLAYVDIALVDTGGTVHNSVDRTVSVCLSGPAVLQGLGTGRPDPTGSFQETTTTTFDGRALAVVRPTGPGRITVEVAADGCDPVQVTVEARLDSYSHGG